MGDQRGLTRFFGDLSKKKKRATAVCTPHRRQKRAAGRRRTQITGQRTEVVALSNASFILRGRCRSSAVSKEGAERRERPSPLKNFFFFFRRTTPAAAIGASGLRYIAFWGKSKHDGWKHISDRGGPCGLGPREEVRFHASGSRLCCYCCRHRNGISETW